MVNLLETLYVVTAVCMVAALVSLARGRQRAARQFGALFAAGVVVCAALYWYLSPV